MRLILKYLFLSLCMLSMASFAESETASKATSQVETTKANVAESSDKDEFKEVKDSSTSDSEQASTSNKKEVASGDDSKYKNYYYRVKRDETLWSIASKFYEYQAPEVKKSISIQQVVVATYGMNRKSFYQSNIHDLLMGSVLTMPSIEQIKLIPKDFAVKKLSRDEKSSLRIAAEKALNNTRDKAKASTLPQVKIWQLINQVGVLNSRVSSLYDEVEESDEKMDSLVEVVSSLEVSGSMNQEDISRIQAEIAEAEYKVKNLETQLAQLQNNKETSPKEQAVADNTIESNTEEKGSEDKSDQSLNDEAIDDAIVTDGGFREGPAVDPSAMPDFSENDINTIVNENTDTEQNSDSKQKESQTDSNNGNTLENTSHDQDSTVNASKFDNPVQAFKDYPWLWILVILVVLLLFMVMVLLARPREAKAKENDPSHVDKETQDMLDKRVREEELRQEQALQQQADIAQKQTDAVQAEPAQASQEETQQDYFFNEPAQPADIDVNVDAQSQINDAVTEHTDAQHNYAEQNYVSENDMNVNDANLYHGNENAPHNLQQDTVNMDEEVNTDIANKLDLARAYSKMGPGEKAEAIAMLSQVLREGNDEQREQALKLLEEL